MIRKLLWAWLVIGTLLMVATVTYGQTIQALDVGGWRPSGGNLACRPGDPCYRGGQPSTPDPGYAWVRPIQPTQQATPAKYAAIVKISAEDAPGVFSSVSGTIVDRNATGAYVLTVSHLFDDWRGGRVIVQVLNQKYAATLLGRDPTIDAAVLKIRDPGIQVVKTSDVIAGESWAGGYPLARALRWVKGRFVGYREQGQSANAKVFTRCAVFSGAVQPGDSGGPVIQNGNLVAVIWGCGDGETYGTPFPIIRRVLGHLVPCWRRSQPGSVAVNVEVPPPVLPGPGAELPLPDDDPLVPIAETPAGVTQDQLNALRDELLAAIAAIPAGRTGDTGQQGARGADGKPGPPGVFDPATLTDEQVAALVKRLPSLTFQAKTPSGKLYGDPVPKRLGDTVFLKTPKGESVQIQVEAPDE